MLNSLMWRIGNTTLRERVRKVLEDTKYDTVRTVGTDICLMKLFDELNKHQKEMDDIVIQLQEQEQHSYRCAVESGYRPGQRTKTQDLNMMQHFDPGVSAARDRLFGKSG